MGPTPTAHHPLATPCGTGSGPPGRQEVTYEAAFLAGLSWFPVSSWRTRGSLGTKKQSVAQTAAHC